MVRIPICSMLLALVVCASVSAQDVDWFNVSSFDVNLVSTPNGQTFHDVTGTIDMVATGQAGGAILVDTDKIVAVNDFMISTCFTFAFHEEVNLLLRVESLNGTEFLDIGSFGEIEYIHESGSMPTISAGVGVESNVIRLEGDSSGGAQTEPARGYVDVGSTHQASWCYTSEANGNLEGLSLGTAAVPEPSTLALLAGVGLLIVLRRRS